MADNFRVIDVRVDELAANLNAITDPMMIVSQDYYYRGEERRVTVLLQRMRTAPVQVQLPPNFDPRRQN